MVQWLRLHASTAEGLGSSPGQVTKIPHAIWYGKKKKMKVVGGVLPLAAVANTFLIVGYPDCRNGGWTETNSLLITEKPAAFLFIFIFFIFKFYIIVLVLPNIKMNPPQVYMCSPS